MSTTRGSNGSTQAPPPFKRECGTGCDPADELEVVKEDLRRITAELSVIKALMVSHAVKHGSYCQKDDVEGLPCLRS